jgi:hypothetical protein
MPRAAAPASPPPVLRYYYRNPLTSAVEGPFRAEVFAGWLSSGALPADAAAALRVWRPRGREHADVPLTQLLADAAAAKEAAAAGAAPLAHA